MKPQFSFRVSCKRFFSRKNVGSVCANLRGFLPFNIHGYLRFMALSAGVCLPPTSQYIEICSLFLVSLVASGGVFPSLFIKTTNSRVWLSMCRAQKEICFSHSGAASHSCGTVFNKNPAC